MFRQDFHDKVLPFDSAAAVIYAALYAERRQAGRPVAMADLTIAAIARAHGAIVVTRNLGDFAGFGVGAINPWDAPR